MPTPDDERFEHYLKQFRPLAPEVLHAKKPGSARLRLSVFAASAVAVVIVLIAAVLMIRHRPTATHSAEGAGSLGVGQLGNLQPLTIGSVNALLARAPSVRAALDQLAHRPQNARLAEGTQSALAVLSREDTKL
jgi:hypothetical protein